MTRVDRTPSTFDEDAVEIRRSKTGQGTDPKPSVAVVEAIADADGRDDDGADFQLYDRIDPEALDRLFGPRHDGTPRAGDGHVVFTLAGYRVTVTSDGEVEVSRSADEPVRCDRSPEDR